MFCILDGTECDKDFDLVFVIDGSGSIEQAGFGNFKKIKEFMASVLASTKLTLAHSSILREYGLKRCLA